MNHKHPTTDQELNDVLQEFVTSIQAILDKNFISAFLQGSIAIGDWDIHSDVDFLVVVEAELSEAELLALQAMHARIYDMDSHWAQHLEGSYFPIRILKRYDPENDKLFYLDNGSRELVRSNHCNELVVRWLTRERGITLAGSDAKTLFDPVPAADLRQEVIATMHDWANEIFSKQYPINNRWAQPFAVLSYCRMLHTLETGRVELKPAGAVWAKEALEKRWAGLIQRAWEERPKPSLKVRQPADPNDVTATLDFIRYALATSNKFLPGSDEPNA